MYWLKTLSEAALVLIAGFVAMAIMDDCVVKLQAVQARYYQPEGPVLNLRRTTNHTEDWETYTERKL